MSGRQHDWPLARAAMLLMAPGLLCFSAFAWTAEGGPWRNYRMKKRFPYNLITSIVPAGDVVWFGGWKMMPGEQDGLGLYDKRTGQWSLRLESEGIFAEEINCLALDGHQLWVGCDVWRPWNRGLYLYDPVKRSHRRFSREDGLPHWRIKDLCLDGDDLWIATHAGAARYRKSGSRWAVYRSRDRKSADENARRVLATDFLICVRADEENVWIGSFEGLEWFHKPTARWQSLSPKDSIFRAHVQAVYPDDDVVYFSSPPAVIVYDRRRRAFRELAEAREAGSHVVCSIRREGEEVFFGTKTGGLYIWNTRTDKWKNFTKENGLGDNWVYALGVDEDYVWCGGRMGFPLCRYDRRSGRWKKFYYREGVPCNYLYSLARVGRWLFVGTMANGIWKYDVRADRWYNLNVVMLNRGVDYYYRAEHTPIQFGDGYAILVEHEMVWLGTNHGLCRYPVKSERLGFEIMPSATLGRRSMGILSLASFQGKIICGTKSKGLWTFDPAKEEWQALPFAEGQERRTVKALCAKGETLWVGTERGLFVLAGDHESAAAVPVRDGLPDQYVTALTAAADSVWIGTRRGLYALEDGRIGPRGQEQGIPEEEITALRSANGVLWIGTRRGLLRYDLASGKHSMLTAENSDLAGNLVGAIAADEHELWVGTLGGGISRGRLDGTRTLSSEPSARRPGTGRH